MKAPRFTARIGVRLLAFNLLLVFLPLAGVLYLGAYEARLETSELRARPGGARLLAAPVGREGTPKGHLAAAPVGGRGGWGRGGLRAGPAGWYAGVGTAQYPVRDGRVSEGAHPASNSPAGGAARRRLLRQLPASPGQGSARRVEGEGGIRKEDHRR